MFFKVVSSVFSIVSGERRLLSRRRCMAPCVTLSFVWLERSDDIKTANLFSFGGSEMPAFSHPMESTGASFNDLIFRICCRTFSQFSGGLTGLTSILGLDFVRGSLILGLPYANSSISGRILNFWSSGSVFATNSGFLDLFFLTKTRSSDTEVDSGFGLCSDDVISDLIDVSTLVCIL